MHSGAIADASVRRMRACACVSVCAVLSPRPRDDTSGRPRGGDSCQRRSPVPQQRTRMRCGTGGYSQWARAGRGRATLLVGRTSPRPLRTVPCGIPCRVGYHAVWATMPCGISCRLGAMPCRIPCRVGYHAVGDTMPSESTPCPLWPLSGGPACAGRTTSHAQRTACHDYPYP